MAEQRISTSEVVHLGQGSRSSAGERLLHTQDVTGSIPVATTTRRAKDWADPERYNGFTPPYCGDWFGDLRIYVMRAGDFSKVGVARDVRKRLTSLQTGCPLPIKLVATRIAPAILAYQIERRVHEEFAERRAMGEWFSAAPDEIIPVIVRLIGRARTARWRWIKDGFMAQFGT